MATSVARSADQSRKSYEVGYPIFVEVFIKGENIIVDARELFSDKVVELLAVTIRRAAPCAPDAIVYYSLVSGRYGIVRGGRGHDIWCRTSDVCNCKPVQTRRPLLKRVDAFWPDW